MPSIESELHQVFSQQGYRVLAIHVGESVPNAVKSALGTGISFPELVDYDNAILTDYGRVGEGVIVFPLAYLLDRQGKIRHIYTVTEPELTELQADIEALLAE